MCRRFLARHAWVMCVTRAVFGGQAPLDGSTLEGGAAQPRGCVRGRLCERDAMAGAPCAWPLVQASVHSWVRARLRTHACLRACAWAPAWVQVMT